MAKKNILDHLNTTFFKDRSVTNFGITLFAILVALIIFVLTVRIYDSSEIPPIKLPNPLCPCDDDDEDNTYTMDTSIFSEDF